MDSIRALATLAEAPGAHSAHVARALGLPAAPVAAAYTDIFVLQLYPYASVYLGAEGMLGGDARERIAGFWRALGLRPPPEPDHLTALLGLYASIVEHEQQETDAARAELWARARATLLNDYLLSWLSPYLQRVSEIADDVYASWASLLLGTLQLECDGRSDVPKWLES